MEIRNYLVAIFGILSLLSIACFIFLYWYRGKVEEERARDLLGVMKIRCVWRKPLQKGGRVHILHRIQEVGANEVAKTACDEVIVGPYYGSVEDAYAEGQRLCPKCQKLTDACVDLTLPDVFCDIDADEH